MIDLTFSEYRFYEDWFLEDLKLYGKAMGRIGTSAQCEEWQLTIETLSSNAHLTDL